MNCLPTLALAVHLLTTAGSHSLHMAFKVGSLYCLRKSGPHYPMQDPHYTLTPNVRLSCLLPVSAGPHCPVHIDVTCHPSLCNTSSTGSLPSVHSVPEQEGLFSAQTGMLTHLEATWHLLWRYQDSNTYMGNVCLSQSHLVSLYSSVIL